MKIVGAAPWTRSAIRGYWHVHPAEAEALEARVPEGATVVLTAGRQPGSLGAVLRAEGIEVARVEPVHRTVGAAVSAVLWEAR
jgi:hypothetical protein